MSVKFDMHYLTSQMGRFMASLSKKKQYRWKKQYKRRGSKALLYYTMYGGTGDGRAMYGGTRDGRDHS